MLRGILRSGAFGQHLSCRVWVAVKGWCPIGFPIALDGGNLCLEIILGRRAPRWGARHIDSIVLTRFDDPSKRAFSSIESDR
jgi:hypothetical protein